MPDTGGFTADSADSSSGAGAQGRTQRRDQYGLKQWYVRNTDERTIAVQQKAGNFTSLFTIFLLCIAAVAASYINNTVYWTLGAAMGVYLLVYLGSLVYYNKKM